MTKTLLHYLFFALCAVSCLNDCMGGTDTHRRKRWPSNPILTDEETKMLADPHVLRHGDVLYLYPTGNEIDYMVYTYNLTDNHDDGDANSTSNNTGKKKYFHRHNVPVYTATINENYPICVLLKWMGIGKGQMAWAPHVFHDDGKFYLYYTQCLSIGVAVSSSPLGPFIDRKKERTLCRFCIDAFVWRDPNNEETENNLYFYYSSIWPSFSYTASSLSSFVSSLLSWGIPGQKKRSYDNGGLLTIYGQRMDTPLHLSKKEKAVRLLRPDSAWEFETGSQNLFDNCFLSGVNEGAWMTYHQNQYILTYSGAAAQSKHYRLGYATSKRSPLGPFTKHHSNPNIIQFPSSCGDNKQLIYGPGHHSLWHDDTDDTIWCFYHSKYSSQVGWERYLNVDELKISTTDKEELRLEMHVTIGDDDDVQDVTSRFSQLSPSCNSGEDTNYKKDRNNNFDD